MLNEYIFNSVALYLINRDISFNNILEYSLLSKHWFKVFQNLIISTNCKHKFDLIIPFNTFIKYVINHNNNNNNNGHINISETSASSSSSYKYKYKLIQFKNIERIKISKLIQNEDTNTEPIIVEIIENFKQFLNGYCPNLKKVTVIGTNFAIFKSSYDYTCGGFYQFKKLQMCWTCSEPPFSLNDIIGQEYLINEYQTKLFVFSFKFISNFMPTKISISTEKIDEWNTDEELEIENMNNLLNYPSIKSINFIDHLTPLSFIKEIFKSNQYSNLKSLKFEISNNYSIDDILFAFTNGEGIQSNKSIKKLIIKNYCSVIEDSNFLEFLELIKSNKTLTSLGFDLFNIDDDNFHNLDPLLEMKNINSLYCDQVNLKYYLNHCNENSNIKKLTVNVKNKSISDDIYFIYTIKRICEFIENNNSSLQIIKLIYSELPLKSISQKIDGLLKNNNYNRNDIKGCKYLKIIHKTEK